MPSYGPVHKLIVYEVGEPYGPLSTSEFADYELEHPAECQYDKEAERYTCGVAFNVENCEARWSLHYTGTPVNEPGEYEVQAWAEVYRGFEYTEYDGGLGLVIHGPDPVSSALLAAGRSTAAETSHSRGSPTIPVEEG